MNDNLLNGYVAIINEALAKYDFEVRKEPDQKDRSINWYALVSPSSSSLFQKKKANTNEITR